MLLEGLPARRHVVVEVTLELDANGELHLTARHGALWATAHRAPRRTAAADVERSLRAAEAQWRERRDVEARSELFQRCAVALGREADVTATLDWLDAWHTQGG